MDKNINIRIFDNKITFLGEVDNYTSFFIILKWETYGEFEFHVTAKYLNILKKGNFIMINKDGKRSGVIEEIEFVSEEKDKLTVKGFTLNYLFTHRITQPPKGEAYHTFNTNVENIMFSLVRTNAVNPTDTRRKIPLLTLGISKGRGEILNFQTRYKVLSEELTALSKTSGLGFYIFLDYKNKRLVFEVMEGNNFSTEQKEKPPIIFSKDFDNIVKETFTESNIGYKNVGYVAGQGEGVDREIVVLNNELSGFERRELFIDARDIDDGENLQDRGKIKLAEHKQVSTFECEVNTRDYLKEWNLGDIVTIVDKNLDKVQHHQVTEVKEIYENGFKVEPTFGVPIPSLAEKMKKIASESIVNKEGIEMIVSNEMPAHSVNGMVWIKV